MTNGYFNKISMIRRGSRTQIKNPESFIKQDTRKNVWWENDS